MKILFLDDSVDRIEKFLSEVKVRYPNICKTVKTAKECIDFLDREQFDLVFLDHDLGDEVFVNSDREDCGMEVVRHLCKSPDNFKIKRIFIHSMNEPAADIMVNKLKDCGYNAMSAPFLLIDWKNLSSNLEFLAK